MSVKPAFFDSHCHIHESEFEFMAGDVYARSIESGLVGLICVGTSVKSSNEAIQFCQKRDKCYYSLALHPHLADELSTDQIESAWRSLEALAHSQKDDPKFVAIGECGLDYFYHSEPDVLKRQAWLLGKHLELSKKLSKPVIFHVREAFPDFFAIYDKYQASGVIHSFSGSLEDSRSILKRPNLQIGLNGIMTFTKNADQLAAAREIPLKRLLLETDAPYLTPTPIRGTINEPKNVSLVARFLSDLREEPEALLIDQTTTNALILFGII